VARALENGVDRRGAHCGTGSPRGTRAVAAFAETIVLNFDQDEAGQKAARKSLEICSREMRGQDRELPRGHDRTRT